MCIVSLEDRRHQIGDEWASPPPGRQRGLTGEAESHITRELRRHGGMMGRPGSLSEAGFVDRAAAAKCDSWALLKPHSTGSQH